MRRLSRNIWTGQQSRCRDLVHPSRVRRILRPVSCWGRLSPVVFFVYRRYRVLRHKGGVRMMSPFQFHSQFLGALWSTVCGASQTSWSAVASLAEHRLPDLSRPVVSEVRLRSKTCHMIMVQAALREERRRSGCRHVDSRILHPTRLVAPSGRRWIRLACHLWIWRMTTGRCVRGGRAAGGEGTGRHHNTSLKTENGSRAPGFTVFNG
jgi:hypothetical protein